MVAWGPAALWAAVLFLLSSLSDVPGASWLPWSDKLVHLALYTVMGAALARGRARSTRPPRHAWLLAAGGLFALSDEWHQSFVPGRDPSAGDLAADGLGLLGGYLVSFLLLVRRTDPEPGLARRRDR